MSLFNNQTKTLIIFYSLLLSSLFFAICNTNSLEGVLNPLRFFTLLLYFYNECLPVLSVVTHSCLFKDNKNTFISLAHLSFPPNSSLTSLPPGNEPQTEKQVEKVSTLSLVRRDTALLLRDFRQGASNWIQSLLDPNRASALPSTAAEAPPGATGIPPSVTVYGCVFARMVGTFNKMWAA